MQCLTLGSKLFTLQKGDLDIRPSWEVPKIITRTGQLWFWRHPTSHFILYVECKGSPVRTKSRCNHRGVCINALDVLMCYIPFVASHVTIVRARFGYSGFGIRSMLNMFHHLGPIMIVSSQPQLFDTYKSKKVNNTHILYHQLSNINVYNLFYNISWSCEPRLDHPPHQIASPPGSKVWMDQYHWLQWSPRPTVSWVKMLPMPMDEQRNHPKPAKEI